LSLPAFSATIQDVMIVQTAIVLPVAAAVSGAASIEGHGMRGGPRGRRWSWRGSVPPAVSL